MNPRLIVLLARSTIESWLAEDIGHHDINNEVRGSTSGRLFVKESGVAAGIEAAQRVFNYFDLSITEHVSAGDVITEEDTVLSVTGDAASMLRAERTAVNIAGHASGIASLTRKAVDTVESVKYDVRIAGTRKTTPGLRGVEKRAIVAGGGDTHRLDLSHMVLIKENHIAEMGLETAIEEMQEKKSFATKIEVEVEEVSQAKRAAAAGADIVLFDNMSPEKIEEGIAVVPSGVLTEASGGISLENLTEYAETGVDVISMGALTHSAPSLDYSFQTNE